MSEIRVMPEEYVATPDGPVVVPWDLIAERHVELLGDFNHFMRGQTCIAEGCFADDYERWLRTL